jgi:hypothetical protein
VFRCDLRSHTFSPLRSNLLGPSRGTPCSRDTKSIDSRLQQFLLLSFIYSYFIYLHYQIPPFASIYSEIDQNHLSTPSAPCWVQHSYLSKVLRYTPYTCGSSCLKHGHQVSTCCGPFRCIRCHRPGHQEQFYHATCSCSPDTCARPLDACGHWQWSHSLSAQPCPPLSCSWVEVLCHSLFCAAVPPRPSRRCCEDTILDSV